MFFIFTTHCYIYNWWFDNKCYAWFRALPFEVKLDLCTSHCALRFRNIGFMRYLLSRKCNKYTKSAKAPWI